MEVVVNLSDKACDDVVDYGRMLFREGYLTDQEIDKYGFASAVLRHISICDLPQMTAMGHTCRHAKYPWSPRPQDVSR